MKVKQLKQLLKRYPGAAEIVVENGKHFTVELKWDSEKGWIAYLKFKETKEI